MCSLFAHEWGQFPCHPATTPLLGPIALLAKKIFGILCRRPLEDHAFAAGISPILSVAYSTSLLNREFNSCASHLRRDKNRLAGSALGALKDNVCRVQIRQNQQFHTLRITGTIAGIVQAAEASKDKPLTLRRGLRRNTCCKQKSEDANSEIHLMPLDALGQPMHLFASRGNRPAITLKPIQPEKSYTATQPQRHKVAASPRRPGAPFMAASSSWVGSTPPQARAKPTERSGNCLLPSQHKSPPTATAHPPALVPSPPAAPPPQHTARRVHGAAAS
jgi:hypothetical protein